MSTSTKYSTNLYLFDFCKEDVVGTINASPSDIDADEISKAVNKLKKNKAAGLDGLPAELLQYGGEAVVKGLTQLFNTIWHTEDVPRCHCSITEERMPQRLHQLERDHPAVSTWKSFLQCVVEQTAEGS